MVVRTAKIAEYILDSPEDASNFIESHIEAVLNTEKTVLDRTTKEKLTRAYQAIKKLPHQARRWLDGICSCNEIMDDIQAVRQRRVDFSVQNDTFKRLLQMRAELLTQLSVHQVFRSRYQ